MKRRRNGFVRVLSCCARCGNGAGDFPFLVDRSLQFHELAVCHHCQSLAPGDPTHLERMAMGLDPANPLDAMEFVERFIADPARVRRTAAHFLGRERYDALLTECRASIEKARAEREAWRDRYVATLDEDDDADDDFIDRDDD